VGSTNGVASLSKEFSDDGSGFMLPSQIKGDSNSDLSDELASDSELDDALSHSKESDDHLSQSKESENSVSSKVDNNLAADGDDGIGVGDGANGQQIEYIDLDNYEPSEQALLHRKARADKYETRLKVIRKDVTRTNTAQATFAPVLLQIVDLFTAAAMQNDQEHLDVLITPLLTEHYHSTFTRF
jgi:hypothetical protein